MRRFLAVESIPPEATAATFRQALERLDRTADAMGLRVPETIFSLERRAAYTLFEADTPDEVRAAHARVGLPTPDVFPVERIHTDLLSPARRRR